VFFSQCSFSAHTKRGNFIIIIIKYIKLWLIFVLRTELQPICSNVL